MLDTPFFKWPCSEKKTWFLVLGVLDTEEIYQVRMINMLFQSSQAKKIYPFLTHLFLRKLVEGGPAKPGGLVHEKIRPSTHYYLI